MILAEGAMEIEIQTMRGVHYFNKVPLWCKKTIGDYTWKVKYTRGEIDNTEIICKFNGNGHWECTVVITATVPINLTETEKVSATSTFSRDEPKKAMRGIMDLQYCGKILFEIKILSEKRAERRQNFTLPFDVDNGSDEHSDICFLVEGKKLYANKTYLSINSSVFNRMFKTGLVEATSEIITINGTPFEDFRSFLRLIFPTDEVVTAENVKGMVTLADFYDVPPIIRACEKFLLTESSEKIPLIEKMELAERYALFELEDECLDNLKRTRIDVVLGMTHHPAFHQLSEKTQLKILRRATDLERHEDERNRDFESSTEYPDYVPDFEERIPIAVQIDLD